MRSSIPARQRVCILGSTGSVGANTLDVIARHADRYEVVALSANTRVDMLLAQCIQFAPRFAVLPQAAHARQLREGLRAAGLRTEVLEGAEALSQIAAHPDVDAVMASIVAHTGGDRKLSGMCIAPQSQSSTIF